MRTRFGFTLAFGLGMLVVASPVSALDFLDDMIYSVKCAGASDVPACKAKAKQDYEDYARKKRNGEIVVADDADPEQRNTGYKERCEQTNASGPANVDVAYNRAMNKYRFQTPEQHAKVKFALPGFNHARVPGVRYDIATAISYPGYKNVKLHVDLVLEKRGAGSSVRVEYCMATSDKYPTPQFHDKAFWRKVASDFRGLVR